MTANAKNRGSNRVCFGLIFGNSVNEPLVFSNLLFPG